MCRAVDGQNVSRIARGSTEVTEKNRRDRAGARLPATRHRFYSGAVNRVRISFQGHVQGVGFRATTRHIATHHRITGWVRNEPDGSVSLEAQGQNADVTAFLEELRAHFVRRITNETGDPIALDPAETSFSILR